MKRFLKGLLMFLGFVVAVASCAPSWGQDTMVVRHKSYASVWVKSLHVPVLVAYVLHKEQVSCDNPIARTNNFKSDPEVEGTALGRDYDHSGYDQGHGMSAQDNECDDEAMNECFYYTNMIPQTPNLNRGVWKKLEVQERAWAVKYDSVAVWIGWSGIAKTIGPDHVVVPDSCWKVIYIAAADKWQGWMMPNAQRVEGQLEQWAMDERSARYLVERGGK